MNTRFVSSIFIVIGIAVGIILALQIRAKPITGTSSPVSQLEIQKSLLSTFSAEQDQLKKKLATIESKLKESQNIMEQRSSRETQKTLAHLKNLIGFDSVSGNGIRITLNDNAAVSRTNFSSLNENFVQATDIRDLINALFLQDAKAIAINGKRVLPLTLIQPVFDSMLVGNFQIVSPFIVTAIGNPESLKESLKYIKKRQLQIFVDSPVSLDINPLDSLSPVQFLSLINPQ